MKCHAKPPGVAGNGLLTIQRVGVGGLFHVEQSFRCR